MNAWWVIIHASGGRVHCWDTGNAEPPDDQLLNTIRVAVGFPDHDEWVHDGSGWDLQTTFGRPHPKLLARATVHTVTDLTQVDQAAVTAHTATRAARYRKARVAAVRAALAELSPAERAEALTKGNLS